MAETSSRADTASAEALRRIEVCRTENQRFLDLSGLGLTTLPPKIGRLTAVIELDLESNHLTTLPPKIGRLTALTQLDLESNKLPTLPSEIGRLTALAALALQTARHGSSVAGRPTILVARGTDGDLVIVDGVTRAVRVADLLPGTLVHGEIVDDLPRPVGAFPSVGSVLS